MGRAPCCDKANVKKGPWSPDEDAKLKAYIEDHGTGGNWIALPQKIGLKRCGKSCRLRWLNYLRPNIKHGDFSEQEDFIICSLYISIGSRWSIMAAQLPGRTDNHIKNYWNTKLKKKFLSNKRDSWTARQKPQQATQERSEKAHGRLKTLNQEKTSEAMTAPALERMQLHLKLQGRHRSPFSFLNNFQSHGSDEMITAPLAVPAGTDIGQRDQQITLGMQTLMEELDFSNFGFRSCNSDPSVSSAVSLDHSSSCSYCNQSEEAGLKFELNNGLLGGLLCDCGGQTINWEKESMDSRGRNDDFKEETILSGPWDLSAIFWADSTIQEWQ